MLGFIRVHLHALVGFLADFEAEYRVFVNYSEVLCASMHQCLDLLNCDTEDDLTLPDRQWEELTSVQVFMLEEVADRLSYLRLLECDGLTRLPRHLVVNEDYIEHALSRR